MTKIGVQILKTHNRFQLTCPFNKKILKVIRKIKKRYYSRINKTWYLPLEEYPAFKDFLSEDPEFEFEVKEFQENIYQLNNSLKKKGNYLFNKVDSLELRFNQSINRNITKSEIESIKKLNNSIKNTKNLIIERIKDSEFQVRQLIQ